MPDFPSFGAILTIAFVLWFVVNFVLPSRKHPDISRYVTAAPLMTPMEQRTIDHIETALPWARVHAQVSMGALLKPVRGLNRSKSTTVRNRFSSKRVDYVIEHRGTGRVVLLIELDDRTHNRAADAARDRITAAAGYITLRLPAGERPSADNVRQRIRSAFLQHPQLARLQSDQF